MTDKSTPKPHPVLQDEIIVLTSVEELRVPLYSEYGNVVAFLVYKPGLMRRNGDYNTYTYAYTEAVTACAE